MSFLRCTPVSYFKLHDFNNFLPFPVTSWTNLTSILWLPALSKSGTRLPVTHLAVLISVKPATDDFYTFDREVNAVQFFKVPDVLSQNTSLYTTISSCPVSTCYQSHEASLQSDDINNLWHQRTYIHIRITTVLPNWVWFPHVDHFPF